MPMQTGSLRRLRRAAAAILVVGVAWAVGASGAVDAAPGAGPAPVPAWVRHDLPERIKPHVGKRGLPDPWPQGPDLGAGELVGVDLWQANNFVVHRAETTEFLYGEYTPTKVDYKGGRFPPWRRSSPGTPPARRRTGTRPSTC